MKIFTYLCITFIFLKSSFNTHAQTVQPIFYEAFWTTPITIQNDVLYISPTEAVLPVRGLKGYAMVMLTDQAKEKWRNPVEGSIIGASKFHDNILVLYTKSQKDQKIRDLRALTLDPSTGGIVENKSILNLTSVNQLVELYRSPKSDFQQLIVRHTNNNGETEKIVMYDISQSLELTQTTNIDAPSGYAYQGAIVTPANDLLVFWTDKKFSVVLERYSKNDLVSKITTPVRHDGLSDIALSAIINPERASDVLCFVKYKNESTAIKTALFDLESKTVKVIDEVIDKNYREQIESSAEIIGKAKQISAGGFNNLCVVAAEFYKNDPVIIKEVSSPNSNPPFAGVAIITVLNRDLKPQKTFLIDKQFRSNSFLPVIAHRINGNKLQVLSSNSKFVGNSTLVFGEIDLDRLKWNKLVPVRAKRSDPNADPMNGNMMLWFGDKPLVAHHWGKQGFKYQVLDLNE